MAEHTQAQICQVPKILELEYHYEQQLTSVVTITNTLDKIVTYKIKSNKPELYLVKPMEGSIYRYDSIKITFKRKELLKKDFQAYLRNPNAFPQQRFLVEIKYSQMDAIGRQKIISQSAYISVRFRASQSSSQSNSNLKVIKEQIPSTPPLKQQRQAEIQILNEKKQQKLAQLQKLKIKIKEANQQKGSKLQPIDMTDLIVLLLLAFMIGFAF